MFDPIELAKTPLMMIVLKKAKRYALVILAVIEQTTNSSNPASQFF